MGLDCCGQALELPVGGSFRPGTQDGLDPVQGVAFASTSPECGLLDTAADFVYDGGGEFDDVKGVQDCGGVSELLVDGGLVATNGGCLLICV